MMDLTLGLLPGLSVYLESPVNEEISQTWFYVLPRYSQQVRRPICFVATTRNYVTLMKRFAILSQIDFLRSLSTLVLMELVRRRAISMIWVTGSREICLSPTKTLWFNTACVAPGDTNSAKICIETHNRKHGTQDQVISHLQPGS